MPDVHSKEIRSFNMSRIKGKNTKPEMLVRKFLFSEGFRFRIHDKKLPGKPDIVMPKYRTIVFINGCFWHGHDSCRYFILPKTNSDWWAEKINRTVSADAEALDKLRKDGWHVITIWECDLKKETRERTLAALPDRIKANGTN
jgi:DNA mismatch endonuclease (patch repair protein)